MRRYTTLAVFAAVLSTAALPARADDCATLMNSLIAQTNTPYSSSITMSRPGTPAKTSLSIHTGSKLYVQVEGQWHTMAMSAKEEIDMVRDAAKTAKQTCQVQGSDTVNGEPATVLMAHVVNRGTTSENKVWLSKSHGGRILKTDVQIQDGLHIVAIFDYNHVTPPAGVK
jgi:hypothetical protein